MYSVIVMCDFVEKEANKEFLVSFDKIMIEFGFHKRKSHIIIYLGNSNLPKAEFYIDLYQKLYKISDCFDFNDSIIIYHYLNSEKIHQIESFELKQRNCKHLQYYDRV